MNASSAGPQRSASTAVSVAACVETEEPRAERAPRTHATRSVKLSPITASGDSPTRNLRPRRRQQGGRGWRGVAQASGGRRELVCATRASGCRQPHAAPTACLPEPPCPHLCRTCGCAHCTPRRVTRWGGNSAFTPLIMPTEASVSWSTICSGGCVEFACAVSSRQQGKSQAWPSRPTHTTCSAPPAVAALAPELDSSHFHSHTATPTL